MDTLALAWRVLCALTAHKPAHCHGHGHGGKTEKNEILRELRHRHKGVVVVLGGLCLHGGCVIVIWTYGHYTTQNHQNARLPATQISRLVLSASVSAVFTAEKKQNKRGSVSVTQKPQTPQGYRHLEGKHRKKVRHAVEEKYYPQPVGL
jgi:hypothetical protein